MCSGLLLLLQEGSRRPFLFATVKGYTGHQESGAGVAGLMEASLLVQHAAAPPALHLRHLNPHLHGALAAHTGGWQCWWGWGVQHAGFWLAARCGGADTYIADHRSS